jgi:ribosomal protein L29
MKKKDKDEMHGMKTAELGKKVAELKKLIAAERLNMMTKEVKNRHLVKELRHKRAVALSILQMKVLSESK